MGDRLSGLRTVPGIGLALFLVHQLLGFIPVKVGRLTELQEPGLRPLFWQALRVTVIYTAVAVPLSIIIGYSIALLLAQKVKWLSVWRTVYFYRRSSQ